MESVRPRSCATSCRISRGSSIGSCGADKARIWGKVVAADPPYGIDTEGWFDEPVPSRLGELGVGARGLPETLRRTLVSIFR
jgi:hypothetical protein